jgi:hypothetical protein
MMTIPIDHYGSEIELEYESEVYLVRDNGAVYCKNGPDCRTNSLDETWTFGVQGPQDGYMRIGSATVHRLVAIAFLGPPPSKQYVVDHIDRDKTNNRIENLRWISNLDNLIRHPGVRKRIISAYGSLDRYFDDPSTPANELDSDFAWLKFISKEDAQKSREQLIKWTESDGFVTHGVLSNRVHGNIRPMPPTRPPLPVPEIQSLNQIAMQRSWKIPTEFPCCPGDVRQNPLEEYSCNLGAGAVFSRNEYGEFLVVMAELGNSFLSVLSTDKNAVKPYAVAKITVENGKFVHEALGTFFDFNGAKKKHFGLLGIPFSGESIDDYC